MPKGEHLDRVRPPKDRRLALLGWEALEPGEASVMIRVRLPREAVARLQALTPKERGRALLRGLEVEDAKADQ